jgi:hypothetical protein
MAFSTMTPCMKTKVLHYTRLERLAKDEHSNLLACFKITKKIKCCECDNNGLHYNHITII